MKRHKQKATYLSSFMAGADIVEMVYDEPTQHTQLAVFTNGVVSYHESVTVKGVRLKPLSPQSDVVRKKVILFPSRATEYGTEARLIADIQDFIHRYLDISPFFEQIAAYYVLLSWTYDAFNEVPYLRALGDYGSGKTRFLLVIGSLCYKPIFAGGATTVSPIFRMLDAHRGTLIFDEADFRFSDSTADIVKILNNGYARGFPVLRSEGKGTFEVKTFEVFSPKVIATRNTFKDKALESRFLVEEMGHRPLRDGIPLSLPPAFETEARELRNQLLWWRFQNYGKQRVVDDTLDRRIQPRLRQIVLPLLSIIHAGDVRSGLEGFIDDYNRDIIADRGMSWEADAFAALLACCRSGAREVTVKQITDAYNDEVEEKETISHKKMGWLLRVKLRLKTQRKEHGYVVSLPENQARIAALSEKLGMGQDESLDDLNVMNVAEGTERETGAENNSHHASMF
jgi:hypothetical protein